MPDLELSPLSWFKYVNVTLTGLAMGKQMPRLCWLKSCSWPNWEAVCLGVLVSSLLNYPLISLFEAVGCPGKRAPLPISGCPPCCPCAQTRIKVGKDLINSNNLGADENLGHHPSQKNFYFIGALKDCEAFNKISNNGISHL